MYKTAKQVAAELIADHAFNIAWSSIGEEIHNLQSDEKLPDMLDEEFDAFQEEVDNWIGKASISVIFEED